jgi:signal transduction histidine kinase
VEDDGIGVDAEHAGAIFDSFHRLHSQSAYEGSGLGLMICRQIVEQHGGKIWVESALVRGSRFIFTLKNVVDAANAGEIDAGAGP